MPVDTVPGPPGSRILGSLRELRADNLSAFLNAQRTYGDVVRFTLGPPMMRVQFFGLFSASGAQHLLATNAANFRKEHSFYNEVRELAGDGLLTSQDETYLRQRRLIQPLFTRKRVDEYGTAITSEVLTAAHAWHQHGDGLVNVSDEMTALTLRVVSRVLFGADSAEAEDTIRQHFPVASGDVVRRGFAPIRIPRSWPTPTNRRVLTAQREMHRVCDRIIATRAETEDGGNDLLSLLLGATDDTGDRLSHREIRDQVLIFLLAGHETTATSLSFALHLLGRHPQVQDEAAHEVDQVLAGRDPGSADYPRLPYLTMVTKEVMRLYPAAPALGRLSVNESTVDGHVVPAGVSVVVSPWVTHRHEEYWPDPEKFDPWRFTPEAEKARPRYAWIPFGGGPRACIGQHFSMLESVLVLAVLLRDFRIESLDPHVGVAHGVTLRPATGIHCRLTPR